MQWITDDKLVNFPFWGGAEAKAKQLSYTDLESLDDALEEYYQGKIPTATEINDLVWNNFHDVCSMIGLECDENDTVIRKDDIPGEMREKIESIRKEAPAIAEAIEAGFKACMEGPIGDVHDRWSDHSYSPDVVISDEPNYTVINSIDNMDPHPARVSVQAYDESDAIDSAVRSLAEHGMPGYITTDEPEHPEDYIEVTGGWVPSHLVNVHKCSGIRATYVPEHFLPALVNSDRTGLSDEDEAELEKFCKDLADSGIPESGLNPVCGPDGEFWDVDDDPATGKAVLCSVYVGK